MDTKFIKTVNQLPRDRGFVEVQDKLDFYIYYDYGGNAQIGVGGQDRVNSIPVAPDDLTPNYGLGNCPAMASSTWLKFNGQIEFHILGAALRKPVWESTYSGSFRDPDKALRGLDKDLSELFVKSFKNFPPKPPK